ncbi:hypothetical protein DL770_010602 [Monosporascus sp. CRB-9-2]|nr:hypothetical protein DL770_010602 [Monosporascus sp. CRB-9-2]
MATVLNYIYPARVPEGFVRLLTILPRAHDNRTHLNLHLGTTALSPKTGYHPRYLALSYVWGPPEQEKKLVYVNGQPFQVGINLNTALVHLENKISLPIWIDAICINQRDSEEKNVQVGQMGLIYRSAAEVLIWLGEGTLETDDLLVQMEYLGARAIGAGIWNLGPKDMKSWPNIDFQKSHIRTSLEQLMSTVSKSRKFPMTALVDLSYRPWFRRVWIVQELCLAVQYRFMCGQRTVPGDNFIAAFIFCVLWFINDLTPLRQANSGPSLVIGMAKTLLKNPSMFVSAAKRTASKQQFMISPRASATLGTRRKFQSGISLTLMQLLASAFIVTSDGPLEASVAKDRVYAFLGIAKDCDELGISPDYREQVTYQQVYAQVASALIRGGRLDILGLCRAAYLREAPYSKVPRDPLLPSWVPDWSKPVITAWGQCFEDQLYHASKNLPRNDSMAMSDFMPLPPLAATTLRLKAMFVGLVSQIGSRWTPHWEKSFDYPAAYKLIQEIEQFLIQSASSSRIYSDQQRNEGVWRIPIGDKELNPLGVTTRATELSYQEYVEMRKFVSAASHEQQYTSLMATRVIWPSYMSNMKDMWDAQPLLTSQGYVGLCPLDTLPHDEIYIPVGAHVPFIFRRVSMASRAHWYLVGEAFLYGAMDGELSCSEQQLYQLDVL